MENKSSMSRAERLRREKITRYSIRKYSFGAASVAVAALFMFLGNGAVAVQADEIQAPQVVESINTQSEKEGTKPTTGEGNATYVAPAVEVVPSTTVAPAAVVTEGKADKPVETTQNSKEEPVVATEKTKEADGVQLPSLTVVADSSALTDEEKANIVEAVKGVNPKATDVLLMVQLQTCQQLKLSKW